MIFERKTLNLALLQLGGITLRRRSTKQKTMRRALNFRKLQIAFHCQGILPNALHLKIKLQNST